MDAFQRGYIDYKKGKPINPYNFGTTEFFDWITGWYAAQCEEANNFFQVAQPLASRESEKKQLADENYLDQQQKLFDEFKESLRKALERYRSKHIELNKLLKDLQVATAGLQNQLNTASESTSDKPEDNQNAKNEPGPGL